MSGNSIQTPGQEGFQVGMPLMKLCREKVLHRQMVPAWQVQLHSR